MGWGSELLLLGRWEQIGKLSVRVEPVSVARMNVVRHLFIRVPLLPLEASSLRHSSRAGGKCRPWATFSNKKHPSLFISLITFLLPPRCKPGHRLRATQWINNPPPPSRIFFHHCFPTKSQRGSAAFKCNWGRILRVLFVCSVRPLGRVLRRRKHS